MDMDGIMERQRQSNVEYEAAKGIRKLLDEAREAYGAEQWDEEEMEARVLELVTDEA